MKAMRSLDDFSGRYGNSRDQPRLPESRILNAWPPVDVESLRIEDGAH